MIDEVLGMLVTLAFIPVGWSGALAGFLLFRVLRRHQAVSRQPAREVSTAASGIMADDAMAGVYANLCAAAR